MRTQYVIFFRSYQKLGMQGRNHAQLVLQKHGICCRAEEAPTYGVQVRLRLHIHFMS